jgi:hypothetical protein
MQRDYAPHWDELGLREAAALIAEARLVLAAASVAEKPQEAPRP